MTVLPPREKIWLGTLFNLVVMLVFAWIVGRSFHYPFFELPRFGVREWLATLAALAACLVLRKITRAMRTEEERRSLIVYKIAPRTPREWTLWAITILVAGIGEEIAYRGVTMSILWHSLGNPWIAALICAIAFALAHATQGRKSVAVVFAIALVMQGLVAFTGTLVFAMLVHIVYDLIAGYLIAREAPRYALSNDIR